MGQVSKRPVRVIIDTDGGIDDALALILALRSIEVQVVGITTVSGNVSVQQATTNSLRVVELLDQHDVWVARGQGNPLIRNAVRATSFHGSDGLGDSNLPNPKLRARQEDAQSSLKQLFETEKKNSVTIACIGPLTNIADFITEHSDHAKGIDRILIMGGAFGLTKYGIGNVTPVAEFNIYSDPEAANIVFNSGLPLFAVGLDVTSNPESWLTTQDYARISRSKGPVSVFARRILARTIQDRRMFELHDPIAVSALVQPSLYHFQEYPVMVETKGEHTTGMTVLDRREKSQEPWTKNTVSVCTNLKAQRFKRLFLGHILD